jgi:hypothetical protein
VKFVSIATPDKGETEQVPGNQRYIMV